MNFDYDEQALLKAAAVWNMPAFLEVYTFHDSALLEFRLRPAGELFVFFNWDLHWNKAIDSEYDLLVIRYAKPYWTSFLEGGWRQPTLAGAKSETVTEAEREQMLDDGRFDLQAYQNDHTGFQPPMMDESLTRTNFTFMNWGKYELLHGAEVSFACFDASGRSGEIPFEKPKKSD